MFQDIEELHLKVGIKTKKQITDAEGYCAAWCIWYSEMRLKYPNLDRKELTKKSLKILMENKHSLRTFIRSYSYELIKYRLNLLRKYKKNNCNTYKYQNKIVDLSLKEYNCILNYALDNFSIK